VSSKRKRRRKEEEIRTQTHREGRMCEDTMRK
jgi:hypothetical protein